MTIDRNIIESGTRREEPKLEMLDCQTPSRQLIAHASAIEALRA
ncbi:hypothetical protein GGD66_002519 [Bradyrhizobium sp. CIR48]|nr:hypothetical protein [Bradyrhizobium sp. CIR48]MBB4398550.1 hypothetical protein [Bradyrhizobium sp. ERR14]MBB4423975.1 hypothetical protein [Bradyrhizobium sp. CIR48]